jgi:hypothetical protein
LTVIVWQRSWRDGAVAVAFTLGPVIDAEHFRSRDFSNRSSTNASQKSVATHLKVQATGGSCASKQLDKDEKVIKVKTALTAPKSRENR